MVKQTARSADTDESAHERQVAGLRAMGPDGRLRLAFEMADEFRRLAADGVRHRHPDYTDAMVERAVAGIFLGDDLLRGVWPRADRVAP